MDSRGRPGARALGPLDVVVDIANPTHATEPRRELRHLGHRPQGLALRLEPDGCHRRSAGARSGTGCFAQARACGT